MSAKQRLTRTLLLVGALLLCVWLVAAHGLRGIAVIAAVAVLTSLLQTRVFRATDQFLVRLTGSRRRAAVLVMSLGLATMVAISVVDLIH